MVSWLLVLPSFPIWDVLTFGRCLGGWGRRWLFEYVAGTDRNTEPFLPFLCQVINGWSSFLFLESEGMLLAGYFKGQPHLSADELSIAYCHMWLVWFRRGSPAILATALPHHMDSQKEEKKKVKIPLTLETPVTEPLFSLPGPVPILWTNETIHLRVAHPLVRLQYRLRFPELL